MLSATWMLLQYHFYYIGNPPCRSPYLALTLPPPPPGSTLQLRPCAADGHISQKGTLDSIDVTFDIVVDNHAF
jgi:hypothetical protein